MCRCIIAGSRDLTNKDIVWGAIVHSGWMEEITEVVCGGAEGVDALGDEFAEFCRIPVQYFLVTKNNGYFDVDRLRNLHGSRDVATGAYENVYVAADWKRDGLEAGPIRNKHMAVHAALDPDGALIAVRKNNSRGTTNMIALAEQYGLRAYVEDIA